MTTLLQINSSINNGNGQSSQLAAKFVAAYVESHPGTQVVKRDLRAMFGGRRAVSSGTSSVAVALEPPALTEFEPDHLVGEERSADIDLCEDPRQRRRLIGEPRGICADDDALGSDPIRARE